MTNTKRLGRYHYHNSSTNDNNDKSSFQSFSNNLASLYKENSRWSLLDRDKHLFGHKHNSLEKVLVNANKAIEKSTKFINKIKSRQLACANRSISIPKNATIRKEYIKCGKEMCEIEHGPYYYAYWKGSESKKLKKRYFGNHIPKNQQFKDNCNNNNQIL